MELSECPYCGEKIWYTEAFFAKTKKIYKCKVCRNLCDVYIEPSAFKILGLAEIISVVIFVAALFAGSTFCLIGAALIICVFLGAYSFVPFALQLFKLKKQFEDDVFTDIKKESGHDTDTEIYSN